MVRTDAPCATDSEVGRDGGFPRGEAFSGAVFGVIRRIVYVWDYPVEAWASSVHPSIHPAAASRIEPPSLSVCLSQASLTTTTLCLNCMNHRVYCTIHRS